MTTPDQLFYAWMKDRLETDSTLSGLNVQIARDDESTADRNSPPKIEYAMLRGPGEDVLDLSFDLVIHVERSRAFGLGSDPSDSGTLDQIDSAMLARVLNVRPTLTGYAAGAIRLGSRRRSTLTDPQTVTLRRDFLIQLVPGSGGAPLAGTDADITGADIPGIVRRWQIRPSVTLSTAHSKADSAVFSYTPSNPSCRGTLDILITDASAPFPAVGSTMDVVFQIADGSSWTNTVIIESHDWIGDRENQQFARTTFMVTDETTPFYGGDIS